MFEYLIGFESDKDECAFLGYIPEEEMFYISLINSKVREGDNPKCFNPPLPEKGAMEFLVQLCISLAYTINPKFKKFELYDQAVIIRNEDWKKDKPLGWLKYFRNYSETAYSKYGFFIREGELELTDSEEGYLLFKKYMSVLKEFIQTNRLKDVLNEEELLEILGEEQRYLETLTLENLIKTIIEDENLIYLYKKLIENEKLGLMINITGEYYLSRYYYENLIKPEDKVSNIKIK